VSGGVGPTGTVLGVDAAPSMLAQARHRAREVGVSDRLSLALGDARRLPVGDGAADLVCAFDVLDLFARADFRTALAECRRVLAPDGRLCVVTMDRASVPDSWDRTSAVAPVSSRTTPYQSGPVSARYVDPVTTARSP